MTPETQAFLRRLAALLLLASVGAAQAASISLASGSVAGSINAAATVNGQSDALTGSLADASGGGVLLGLGSGSSTLPLAPAGSLNHLWSASTSFDTSAPAQALFQAAASSVRWVNDVDGDFVSARESLALVLDAEIMIGSTGEALGTPVQLDLAGSAESVFNSSGPALDVLPSFDLVLRDAQGVILASWQGLAPGGAASFALSVASRVGDTLQFSLSHASSLLADGAAINAGNGLSLDATAALTGTMTVTVVPEPESYALFLAGLAALGLLHTRHRLPR